MAILGIFLIMGNAGFISSALVVVLGLGCWASFQGGGFETYSSAVQKRLASARRDVRVALFEKRCSTPKTFCMQKKTQEKTYNSLYRLPDNTPQKPCSCPREMQGFGAPLGPNSHKRPCLF